MTEPVIICARCNQEKSPDDFAKSSARKSGRQIWCRKCMGAHSKQHRPEYNRQNRVRDQQYRKGYIESNPERKYEYRKRSYVKCYDQRIADAHQYRARRAGATGSFTAREFEVLCEHYGWKCAYCGIQLDSKTVTKDHVVPLSRGGSNDIGNILPACKSCNFSKGTRTPEEWTNKK